MKLKHLDDEDVIEAIRELKESGNAHVKAKDVADKLNNGVSSKLIAQGIRYRDWPLEETEFRSSARTYRITL